MKEYNIYGDCAAFVADYANKYCTTGATICARWCKGSIRNGLVHCYFRLSNGNYIDSRLIEFTNENDLLAIFDCDKSDIFTYDKNLKEFKNTLVKNIGETMWVKYTEEDDWMNDDRIEVDTVSYMFGRY